MIAKPEPEPEPSEPALLNEINVVERSEFVPFTNRHGRYLIAAFKLEHNGLCTEHVVLSHEQGISADAPATVRINSACFTSDIFGCTRCDCHWQLQESLRIVATTPNALLVYLLADEGRGLGITKKLKSYKAMDEGGLSTHDAFRCLGYRTDVRSFASAAVVLSQLGIACVRLLTNNPTKIATLERYGFEVSGVEPLVAHELVHLRPYLKSKAAQFKHRIALP